MSEKHHKAVIDKMFNKVVNKRQQIPTQLYQQSQKVALMVEQIYIQHHQEQPAVQRYFTSLRHCSPPSI